MVVVVALVVVVGVAVVVGGIVVIDVCVRIFVTVTGSAVLVVKDPFPVSGCEPER